MIVMVNKAQFFLVPPVRWATDERLLDNNTINFKAPEALENIKIDPSNLQLLHKKFVWKFGLMMYLAIHKTMPFTFADACGPSAKIDEHTVKKFAQLIRYRVENLPWNPATEPINAPLRKALVYNYQHRATFTQLYTEFSHSFAYYQPKEVALAAHHLSSLDGLAPDGRTGEAATRQVEVFEQKSNTVNFKGLKTPFDEPERKHVAVSNMPKMNAHFKATPFVDSGHPGPRR